jgi:hypothetical protein
LDLNVTLVHDPLYRGKTSSLDFLGYGFDVENRHEQKLDELRVYGSAAPR